MDIFLIDDDEYWHLDAARKLKRAGFKGSLSCFYGAPDFFSNTTEEDRKKALVVVDFDLDSHDAIDAKIAERVRESSYFSGKLVLCSLLSDFGPDNRTISNNYDLIVEKSRLDWSSLLTFNG